LRLFIIQGVSYGYNDYIFVYAIWWEECHQKKKEEQRVDHLCLMSIATIKYIQDKKTYSSINKTKSYKCDLIKDMKTCVNHDGSWRRINKDLATMNPTSEKCKRESWRRGIGCDGERKMDLSIRGIMLAMECHISLSINLYWIIKKRWHGQGGKS
jgi:hypothetical protein